MGEEVKRTERGWAGHYICADKCRFRRNTLLEYKDRKWVVSTVGGFVLNGKLDMIGADRWFETMVFEAELQHGYWDAIIEKRIYPEQDWGLWGSTWEEVTGNYGLVDNAANDMHERIVDEMSKRIIEGTNENI